MAEQDPRIQKQHRKMTRILSKAWALEGADVFQSDDASSTTSSAATPPPLDLQTIGQTLDGGEYDHGRSGWERFANEIGGVYQRHAKSGSSKKLSKLARRHLETVAQFLSKIDSRLGDIALNAPPPQSKPSSSAAKNEGRSSVSKKSSRVPPTQKSKPVNGGATSAGKKGGASGMPRNQRECENERKRLKRELDKLLKAHRKASKALDDIRNDRSNERYPVDDELLKHESNDESGGNRKTTLELAPDFDCFPGIPPDCLPETLMVWDFLCTFHRTLSLDPMGLDDFVAALTHRPGDSIKTDGADDSFSAEESFHSPLYLAEAHVALLNLLLEDKSSDSWWWCTLNTDSISTENQPNVALQKSQLAGSKRKRPSDGVNNDQDKLAPVIKVDMAALLAVQEDAKVTASWLQALEAVRSYRANVGAPFKSAIKSAMSITTNAVVKAYLKKAMRKWRGNSAAFTKRAILWLVDKVREARPDLWGRQVSEAQLAEQATKVAAEAALAMVSVNEDASQAAVSGNEDSGSECSSDEEDEAEFSDDSDDFAESSLATEENDHANASETSASQDMAAVDSCTPVTTTSPSVAPPTAVDLLLPSRKPVPKSDVVTVVTWACLAGAASRRILHHFKRQRNEVDDRIRERRQLPAMFLSERRRREAKAPQRIFSECSFLREDQEQCQMEAAINDLCDGKPYHTLTTVQKLFIFRVLIEAAYETAHVTSCVNENFNSRLSAVKALETESRRAKREAKEELAAAEVAARERLANEARATFLKNKRREIETQNRATREHSTKFIEALTDEAVAEFDEETKADYKALPTPKSFNKSEVAAMVTKVQEAAAFETNNLEVLTLEEIESREQETLSSMKEELATYGDVENVYESGLGRETSAKVNRLRREITNFEVDLLSLPHSRSLACDALQDAIEDGTVKTLRSAIKAAKQALLTGADEINDSVWVLDILRDAVLELRSAERRRRVTDAQKDLVTKRNRCFIRTEPIGRDRFRNNYWHFDFDEAGRIWAEQGPVNCRLTDGVAAGNEASEAAAVDSYPSGLVLDEEEDLIGVDLLSEAEKKEKLLAFYRKEYHSSGSISSLPFRRWGCFTSDRSLRLLIKCLDERGTRECALKAELKQTLEQRGAAGDNGNEGQEDNTAKAPDSAENASGYQDNGDEQVFAKALLSAQEGQTLGATKQSLGTTTAIGQRVRLRRNSTEDSLDGAKQYDMGTVVGWRDSDQLTPKQEEGKLDQNGAVGSTSDGGVGSPLWRVALDKGGDAFLGSAELIQGMSRAHKWQTQADGYFEEGSPFLSYRNTLRKKGGKAVDTFIDTPESFSKVLIKREIELYTPLRNRALVNNWGKSGARIAWQNSLKEYGHKFSAARDGLLTFEKAIFELISGSENDPGCSALSEGRSLLDDATTRSTVELESYGVITGLWNSVEARTIFHELMQNATSVGLLTLGLELLCRNCKAFFDATKPKGSDQLVGVNTRRQNAWQLSNQQSYY